MPISGSVDAGGEGFWLWTAGGVRVEALSAGLVVGDASSVEVVFPAEKFGEVSTVGVDSGVVTSDVVVDGVTVQVSGVARGFPWKTAGGEFAGFTGGPELVGVSGVMSSDMGSYTVTFRFDEVLDVSQSVEVREFVQTGVEVVLGEASVTITGDRMEVVYSRLGQEARFDRMFGVEGASPVFTVGGEDGVDGDGDMFSRGVRDDSTIPVYGFVTGVVCDSCPVFTVSDSTPGPVVLDGLTDGPDLVSVTEVSSDADIVAGWVRLRFVFDEVVSLMVDDDGDVVTNRFWLRTAAGERIPSGVPVLVDGDDDGVMESVDVVFSDTDYDLVSTVGVDEGAVIDSDSVSNVVRGFPLKPVVDGDGMV